MTSYRNEAESPSIDIHTITPAFPRPVFKADEADNIHINEAESNRTENYSSRLALIIILLIAMDMI